MSALQVDIIVTFSQNVITNMAPMNVLVGMGLMDKEEIVQVRNRLLGDLYAQNIQI